MPYAGKTIAWLLLGALFAGVAHADPRDVRRLGRAESLDNGAFAIQWPASGFEARVRGRSLTVTISDEAGANWLNVEVDGKLSTLRLTRGAADYVIFSDQPGDHIVRITRRTNGNGGVTSILGVRSNGKIEPTEPPQRRILAIGDSIMSGYGVEGADRTCAYSKETQNAGIAYPALIARDVSADLQVLAMDGWGIAQNYRGGPPTMKELTWQTLPSVRKPWPLSGWTPQVVIVGLGTNDFAGGDPGVAFDTEYKAFLQKLRGVYRDAEIFGVFGGMLSGEQYNAGLTAVTKAVADLRKAGDSKIHFVEFTPPKEPRRWGCNWHPGIDAQRYMARTLQTEIGKYVAW